MAYSKRHSNLAVEMDKLFRSGLREASYSSSRGALRLRQSITQASIKSHDKGPQPRGLHLPHPAQTGDGDLHFAPPCLSSPFHA